MVDDDPSTGRVRVLGWLAVAAQFACLAALVILPGSSGAGWARALGAALMVGGGALMLIAFAHLGRSLTPTPVPNGSGVVSHGVYRWFRHPIYVAVALFTLGVVLRSPGTGRIVAWLLLVAILVAKAMWEERMLESRHPEYRDYRSGTGRFLPGARRREP